MVAATLTLLLVGYLAFSFLNDSIDNRFSNYKDAMRMAEDGMQDALERLNSQPGWTAGIPRRERGDGFYQVTVRPLDSISLEITATGTVLDVSRNIRCVVAKEVRDSSSVFTMKSWKQE
jgi:hypothetical protein